MPKSNQTCDDILDLIFNATALPWADITNIYVSLHTASPGVTGNQETNEVDYEGYERVTIARTDSGFTILDQEATNVAEVEFPQNTGADVVVTHFAVGTSATGTGQILYFNTIEDQPITISTSIIPRIPIGNLSITEE